MAESRLVLVPYILLVSMTVMVKADPTGNFWCNCTEFNLVGRTSDYSENCDAQCRPTVVALQTSAASAPSTIHSPTGNLWCNCTEYNLDEHTSDYSENCDVQCQPTMVAMRTETSGVGVHETTVHLAMAMAMALALLTAGLLLNRSPIR